MMRITNPQRLNWLIGLQLFNGVSAVGGGLALMSQAIDMPDWVVHTNFPSLYFPGVILFAAVGGSALVAAVSLLKRLTGSALMSLIAGTIMEFWIIGEIVSIRGLHWLQAIYLISGAAVVWLTREHTP